MDFLTETALHCKRDLADITFVYLLEMAGYLNITVLDKDAIAWILAIKLLSPGKKSVRWSENIVLGETIIPGVEPETRGELNMEWAHLEYPDEARICLTAIMNEYDAWDTTDLSELDSEIPVLNACFKVLRDDSSHSDRMVIRKHYSRLASISRRKILLKKIKTNRLEKKCKCKYK